MTRRPPRDLPPWSLVHYYFWHWKSDGTWQAVHDQLVRLARQKMGRSPAPSAAVLDSQSVKTTEKGGRAAMTEQLHPTATKGSTAGSVTYW